MTPQVPSPCINVCELDVRRSYCTGCLRTVAEITAWRRLSPEEKREILNALPGRREQLTSQT